MCVFVIWVMKNDNIGTKILDRYTSSVQKWWRTQIFSLFIFQIQRIEITNLFLFSLKYYSFFFVFSTKKKQTNKQIFFFFKNSIDVVSFSMFFFFKSSTGPTTKSFLPALD